MGTFVRISCKYFPCRVRGIESLYYNGLFMKDVLGTCMVFKKVSKSSASIHEGRASYSYSLVIFSSPHGLSSGSMLSCSKKYVMVQNNMHYSCENF